MRLWRSFRRHSKLSRLSVPHGKPRSLWNSWISVGEHRYVSSSIENAQANALLHVKFGCHCRLCYMWRGRHECSTSHAGCFADQGPVFVHRTTMYGSALTEADGRWRTNGRGRPDQQESLAAWRSSFRKGWSAIGDRGPWDWPRRLVVAEVEEGRARATAVGVQSACDVWGMAREKPNRIWGGWDSGGAWKCLGGNAFDWVEARGDPQSSCVVGATPPC